MENVETILLNHGMYFAQPRYTPQPVAVNHYISVAVSKCIIFSIGRFL